MDCNSRKSEILLNLGIGREKKEGKKGINPGMMLVSDIFPIILTDVVIIDKV